MVASNVVASTGSPIMEEIHIPDGDEDEVFVIYDSATHEAV
jgi:hypothetical protein